MKQEAAIFVCYLVLEAGEWSRDLEESAEAWVLARGKEVAAILLPSVYGDLCPRFAAFEKICFVFSGFETPRHIFFHFWLVLKCRHYEFVCIFRKSAVLFN